MTEVKEIPVKNLEKDRANIRPKPDLTDKFVENIKDEGILEPLIVRPRGKKKYGVIVGYRRFAAARRLKLDSVSCVVRKDLKDDMDARATSFAENEHREDIPTWKKREIIREFYDNTDGRKSPDKRAEEVSNRLNISVREIRDHLSPDNLPDSFLPRLKKPSERSDSEKKALEDVSGLAPSGEEKPLFDERSKEKAPSSLDIEKKISLKVMSKLARDESFLELAEKNPLRAHRLATIATEAGQNQVKKVLEIEREGPKERAKPLKEELQPEDSAPEYRINFGSEITPALQKFADEHNVHPKTAVRNIVRGFLIDRNYLDRKNWTRMPW